MRRGFPFRFKLALLIGAVAAPLLLAQTSAVQRNVESSFRDQIGREIGLTAQVVGQRMADRRTQLENQALVAGEDRLVRVVLTDQTLTPGTRNDIIKDEVLPKLAGIAFLAVLDPDGAELGASQPGGDLSLALESSPAVRAALDGEAGAGHIYTGDAYWQVTARPIFIGMEMAGLVIAARPLEAEELEQVKRSAQADLVVFRDAAPVLSTRWSARHGRPQDAFLADLAAFIAAHPGALDAVGVTLEVPLGGERFLMRMVREEGGIMPPYAVIESLDRALVLLETIRVQTIWISVVGVCVVLLAGYLFSVGVSRPIARLVAAMAAVRRGDLDHRVEIRTRDEFAALGDSFNDMIQGLAEKERIRRAFDRSVSEEVADKMLAEGAAHSAELREASILFCDIRDFVSLTEALPPDRLIGLLNRYFGLVGDCIEGQGGAIDKFIGDAVMGLFGLPSARPDHGLMAVRAALDIVARIDDFNQESHPPIRIGVAVASGPVVAGFVGSAERLSYTALGETVNRAARLEKLTKIYGAPVIIAGPTLEAIAATCQTEDLLFRRLDVVQVRGSAAGLPIFEALPATPELASRVVRFDEAHRALLEGRFAEAISGLAHLAADWPQDLPTQRLLHRAREYQMDKASFARDYQDGIRVMQVS